MSQNPWAFKKIAMAPREQVQEQEQGWQKRAECLTYLDRPQAAVHPTPTWPKEDNNPAWGKWTMPQYSVFTGKEDKMP